ncbi:MotA/TolQ/ExbB proton channel family protein [Bacteroidales bacterium OttesenSCG-928-B11]|nr:MotA/TolQ/ExbB proton channel family protein [Bacteroidales bacterium OttesenSCG-928-E04]MDL2309104.1 MotA/TolQ/ExbB proton channel family protein [Bacteroidales bacterium OttesenSCG-928-C03]MDL2312937.1 MotA/TolQ/ExbB proton channel family protein [Bacteroidales bacterium OttesenSCG-928-B11]
MKKLIALLTVIGLFTFGINNAIFAQEDQVADNSAETEQVEETPEEAPAAPTAQLTSDDDEVVSQGIHFVLKDKFIQGGAMWMAPVLICLILGLAFCIERIFYLNLASTNSSKLLDKIEEALKSGGVAKAKQLCADTKGPLAGIFYEGLDRYDEGLESVEKAVESYGGVQMGKLETNMSWIGLFLALGPSLGFMGTVVGMVQAFDDIERAGDISPTIVAGGMKVALLTTVFGLITAIILQIFYNYILSKIDAIVNDMEDATIGFMDVLIKNK